MLTDEQEEEISYAIAELIKDIEPKESAGSLFITSLVGAGYSPRECAGAMINAVAFLAIFSHQEDNNGAAIEQRIFAIAADALNRAHTYQADIDRRKGMN